jgi:hypothetical protein
MRTESVVAFSCALVLASFATRSAAQSDTLEPELPPRYQIELIAFSYRDFDPSEENLDDMPALSAFRTHVLPKQRILDDEELDDLRRQVEEPIVPGPLEEIDTLLFPQLIELEPTIEIPPPPNPRILLPEEFELADVYERLDRLGAYTILFHGGWEQDGMAEDVAVPMALETLGATNPVGWIRLHMNRFLHVRVDVAYDTDVAATLESGDASIPSLGFDTVPPAPIYYLYEQRRVLRGEINYFDHPAFGVLIVVRLAPERIEPDSTTTPAVGPSA